MRTTLRRGLHPQRTTAHTQTPVDFAHVPPEQETVHRRLENWAQWVRVRPPRGAVHPMWHQVLSSRQWDTHPQIRTEVDLADAQRLERAVVGLPDKQRSALRWYYVRRAGPAAAALSLSVTTAELSDLVKAGRAAVIGAVGL